jgi:hypothetical protein
MLILDRSALPPQRSAPSLQPSFPASSARPATSPPPTTNGLAPTSSGIQPAALGHPVLLQMICTSPVATAIGLKLCALSRWRAGLSHDSRTMIRWATVMISRPTIIAVLSPPRVALRQRGASFIPLQRVLTPVRLGRAARILLPMIDGCIKRTVLIPYLFSSFFMYEHLCHFIQDDFTVLPQQRHSLYI